MYFKRLELSGFKSFAKATSFEFLTPITGVVGPNGSGKSNVVEGVKWVLGEQSYKSLRGKKGEDFIFSGSDKAPRLSRASASIVLDNSKKQLPIEFEEVIITRQVDRSGANAYLLNGSRVRLKDINDLLGKVGLGASQHHIISQGEADRLLMATIEERRNMVEESLGLKSYHLKRAEAERKLSRTEENMREITLLQKEIRPHLKYLGQQYEKMQKSEELRKELELLYKSYLVREQSGIHDEEALIENERAPFLRTEKHLTEEIAKIIQRIKHEESRVDAASRQEDGDKAHARKLVETEERIAEVDRELGGIELRLKDLTKRESSDDSLIRVSVAKGAVEEMREGLKWLLSESDVSNLHKAVRNLLEKVEGRMRSFGMTTDEDKKERRELQERQEKLNKEREDARNKLKTLLAREREEQESAGERFKKLRDEEHGLRLKERERGEAQTKLKEFDFRLEKLAMRKRDHEETALDARRLFEIENVKGNEAFEKAGDRETMQKQIDRLRIRVEESGAVDPSVIREFEETQERDEFLAREMEDILTAKASLEGLVGELTEKLEKEFTKGIAEINKAFKEFFTDMFGGGSADLQVVEYKKRKKTDEDSPEEESTSGVDVRVNIPGKRIHALDMLSGGERALTSIALLFAMSAVNPPPFLILDETDAALDEANSQRYASLLTSLSKRTQLIVVTHNRETMRSAQVLYGVTMSNDSISRLLSLKFDEAIQVAK